MSEFFAKQFVLSPLFLFSLKVFSKRQGPVIHRPSSVRRPTKVQKGPTASPSMTFGLEEVQTKPAKALLGSMRRRKKKKRIQQQQQEEEEEEEAEETEKTSSSAADNVSKQEEGDFESFTHYNSPLSLGSAEQEPEGWVYEKKMLDCRKRMEELPDIGILNDENLKINSTSQKRPKLIPEILDTTILVTSHICEYIFRHADTTTGFGKKVFGSGTKVLPDKIILVIYVSHLQPLSEDESESFLEKMIEHVKKKGGPYKMQEHAANKKRKPPSLAKKTKGSEPTGLSGQNSTTLKRVLTRRPTPLKKVKLRQTSTIRHPSSPPPSVKVKQDPASAPLGQFGQQPVKPTSIGGQPSISGQLSDDIGDPPQPSAEKFLAIKATTTTTSSPSASTTTRSGKPPSEDKDQIRYFYQSLSSPLFVIVSILSSN